MPFKVKWRSAVTDLIAMPLPRRQLVSLDAVRFWPNLAFSHDLGRKQPLKC